MNKQSLSSIIKDFNGVTAEEVLEFEYEKIPGGQIPKGMKVGGNLLPIDDIKQLISEATFMRDSFLWKLLSKRVQFMAQLKSVKAESDDRLIFPKAMIVAVQEMEKVISSILTIEKLLQKRSPKDT